MEQSIRFVVELVDKDGNRKNHENVDLSTAMMIITLNKDKYLQVTLRRISPF